MEGLKLSEIPAEQARELLENREEWNIEFWYAKWKDKFFDCVKEAALLGYDSIKVDSDEWGKFKNTEEYLKVRLTTLGYEVKFINNVMVVQW